MKFAVKKRYWVGLFVVLVLIGGPLLAAVVVADVWLIKKVLEWW